jgi:hypothetical protein
MIAPGVFVTVSDFPCNVKAACPETSVGIVGIAIAKPA